MPFRIEAAGLDIDVIRADRLPTVNAVTGADYLNRLGSANELLSGTPIPGQALPPNEVTGGSIDNLKLIGAGKSELAFTMADAAAAVLEMRLVNGALEGPGADAILSRVPGAQLRPPPCGV